jgi:hypothetical protein
MVSFDTGQRERDPVGQKAASLLADAFGFRSVVVAPAPSAESTALLGVLVLGSQEPGFFENASYVGLTLVVGAVSMKLHERRTALAGKEFLKEKAQAGRTGLAKP